MEEVVLMASTVTLAYVQEGLLVPTAKHSCPNATKNHAKMVGRARMFPLMEDTTVVIALMGGRAVIANR